ncbi:MAG: ribbon-helix-helix protein, CopG family [Streptosporangiaceae bacterium]
MVRPSAFRHGVDERDIQHAVRNALVVEEIGDDPVRYLALAQRERAASWSWSCWTPVRAAGDPRDGDEAPIPAAAEREMMTMPATHDARSDGTPVTDAVIGELADEAERGYDVDRLIGRHRGGRPAMGASAASVESVRLDSELKRDLLLRASAKGRSVSDVIRSALRQYLKAS